ncbi:MAG: methyltransferase domain-containing protein [Synergistales bacterium]|nr:methyltransferase domain-containing protein [Synergistales bacterium]
MQYDEGALQAVRERRLLIDEYDSWLVEELRPFLGQRVIEVGCGLGNLLKHFVDRELVVGIETSPETVTEAKRKFAGFENVSIYEYSITDQSVLALQEMKFDSAVSLNVFEHIEDDELAMQHTALLLKPSGYFVLIVPAHQWLYGTMDSSIGHYRRYTKALAKEKLEKTGFRIVHQKYLNTLGAIGWFVNGRFLRRNVPPSGQLRMFNKIVPILKAVERVFTPPFGISLITVAQRKSEVN